MFEGYSDTDKANITEVFNIFAGASSDEKRLNGEKCLDFHELMCAMRALGFEPTKREVMSIMEKYDPSSKRKVNLVQFEKEMAILFKKRDPIVEIERAFKLFAADGQSNGEGITYESLKAVASELGEIIDDNELRAMVDEFDLNGDGNINLDEFIRICGR